MTTHNDGARVRISAQLKCQGHLVLDVNGDAMHVAGWAYSDEDEFQLVAVTQETTGGEIELPDPQWARPSYLADPMLHAAAIALWAAAKDSENMSLLEEAFVEKHYDDREAGQASVLQMRLD